MNLSISNIGWAEKADNDVYALMIRYGFTGLEIAPTKVFPEKPYDRRSEAGEWSKKLYVEQGLSVPSMQSIWYGQSGNIFGSEEERQTLTAYTRKAIDFAEAIGCGNLVFGCPKNRVIPEKGDPNIAVEFFRALGDYAFAHHTVLALEANPPIYNTNFINRTEEAIQLIERVDSRGFRLNLDVGTMIENGESVEVLAGREHLINHVHISEPGLRPLRERDLHNRLAAALRKADYEKFVSIEVGRQDDIRALETMMSYVRDVF